MKVNKKILIIVSIVLGCFLVALPLGWFLLTRFEGEKPSITIQLPSSAIGVSLEIPIHVSDHKSGVRSIWVGLLKDGEETVLIDRQFPSAERRSQKRVLLKVNISPTELGFSDGPATIRVAATDYSWRQWWHGNVAYLEKRVTIDTQPPGVNVLSRSHYIRQGGAALVIYRLSEACQKSGVHVADKFFPGHNGYFRDDKIFMAFIAVSVEQQADAKIYISATDLAGNHAQAGFPYHIKPQHFKKDTVIISDKYLNWKMPGLEIEGSQDASLSTLDKFVIANSELRQQNFRKVAELGNRSTEDFRWKGAFLRLPKSARTAGFGDYRKYQYNGHVIDQQVHLGIDLASVARSPVPAANDGQVQFTGKLGIFGNTVIIDHGFGLLSMYSHLSQVTVEEKKTVAKGEIIGRTGMTGLAGGDHLHFAIIIHDTFVDPVEWWDAAWIENNITAKIKTVKNLWQ